MTTGPDSRTLRASITIEPTEDSPLRAMCRLFNFTNNAFANTGVPKVTGGHPTLRPHHALSLVNSCSGVLLGEESCRISLPFTVEEDERGFHLRSHFPAFRKVLVEKIRRTGHLEVLFDTGEYYIDPEWVLREEAHAPTEVKAVFSIIGAARFVDVSRSEAIDHLDRVRAFRQIRFNPTSKFTVGGLPSEHLDKNLSQILHFELDVERIEVSQVMALLHLKPEHRSHVVMKLDHLGDAKAQEAAQIMRFFS